MKTLIAGSLLALAVAACGGEASTAAPTIGTEPNIDAPTTAPATTPAPAESEAVDTDATPVIVKDFTLDPIDVVVDGPVSLAVTNEGPTLHNVAIRDEAGEELGTTRDLREGESETLTVDLPAGDYVLFCSLPGHESLGIKGTLAVRD